MAADFGGNFGFAASEIENGLDSMLVAQFPRKGNKFVDGPTLGEIFRAGVEHGVGFTRCHATRGELLGDQSLRIGPRTDARGRNWSTRQPGGVKLLQTMRDGMYAIAGIGNEHIVNKRELTMRPADALRHSDGCDQQCARGSGMLIIDDGKMTAAQLGDGGKKGFRQQDFGNSRIAFKQWRAEGLDEDAQTQIGTPRMEGGEGWGQENDVSERTKADN